MNNTSSYLKTIRFQFLLSLIYKQKMKSNNKTERQMAFYCKHSGLIGLLTICFPIFSISGLLFFIQKNKIYEDYADSIFYFVSFPLFVLFSLFIVFAIVAFIFHYFSSLTEKINGFFYKDFLDELASDDKKDIYKVKHSLLNHYFNYPMSAWSNEKTELFFDVLAYCYFDKTDNIQVEYYFNHHVELLDFFKKKVVKEIELVNENQFKYVIDESHSLNKLLEDIVDFNINSINKIDDTLSNIIRQNKYWRVLFKCVQEELNLNNKTSQEIQQIKNKLIEENKQFQKMYEEKNSSMFI